jgi:hypothetical protein
MFIVMSKVREPRLAAAAAASQPACPAPTTMTSYSGNINYKYFEKGLKLL